MRSPLTRALLATLLGAIALAAWALLAPRQLPGGSASYVVPAGSSMQPILERDDLVVTRDQSAYAAGDVIAYQSESLERIVLHRILRIEGDRYVTKGDNNDWIDRDRPTNDQILGKMMLRIPGGGTALAWMRTPRNAAVAGSAAAVLVMGGVGLGVRRRRRGRRRGDDRPSGTPRATRPAHGLRAAAAALGVASLGFGAFAAFAHARPETRTVPTRVPYEHSGSFGYVALAEPGAVYPDGQVDSGEPVFLKVTDHVGVRFIYRFSSDEPHAVAGTVSLAADLEDGTGWRRSFSLQQPTSFTGDEAVAMGDLDLPKIGGLIRQVEKATEIPRPSYTLTLRASVEVEATAAGRPVHQTFAPELMFDANPLLLRVAQPEDPQKDVADALSSRRGGSVVVRDHLPNPLSIGPIHVASATARRMSLAGLGVSAVLFLVLGLFALRRQPTESARIQARYGHRIVPVAAGGASLEGPVVDVATIGALVQVADSYERMILHEERGGAHWYLVEGDVAVYRHRTDDTEAPLDDGEFPAEAPADPSGGTFLDEPPEPDDRFLDDDSDRDERPEPPATASDGRVEADDEPLTTAAPTPAPSPAGPLPTQAAEPPRPAAASGVVAWPALPSAEEERSNARDHDWVADEDWWGDGNDDARTGAPAAPAPNGDRAAPAEDPPLDFDELEAEAPREPEPATRKPIAQEFFFSS